MATLADVVIITIALHYEITVKFCIDRVVLSWMEACFLS